MEQTAKHGTEYGYRYVLHRGYNIYLEKKIVGLAKDRAVNHREDGVDCRTEDRAPASMKIEQFASITTDRFVWLGAEQFAREGGQSGLSGIG
jgi:hypothetical protein